MNQLLRFQINQRKFTFFFVCLLFCFLPSPIKLIAAAKASSVSSITPNNLKLAFLNINENNQSFLTQFFKAFQSYENFRLLDTMQSSAAARGSGYNNLLNLSLDEARNLGTAIDCDFFFVIKSDTVRRSSFARNSYFESYAVIFLVSARSGRLIGWKDAHYEADSTEKAEKLLLVNAKQIATNFADKLFQAAQAEKNERLKTSSTALQPVELSDAETSLAQNYRVPLPYKNLRPSYTEAARRLEIEATVDVAVDLNEDGVITQTEVIRWAGFDLDEETTETVKKMHFRPALHNGKPLPVRILLRYNFRDLSRKDEKQ